MISSYLVTTDTTPKLSTLRFTPQPRSLPRAKHIRSATATQRGCTALPSKPPHPEPSSPARLQSAAHPSSSSTGLGAPHGNERGTREGPLTFLFLTPAGKVDCTAWILFLIHPLSPVLHPFSPGSFHSIETGPPLPTSAPTQSILLIAAGKILPKHSFEYT